MNITEEEIHEWGRATAWSIEKIKEELQIIKCNRWDALKVYGLSGVLPTSQEQALINDFGVDAMISYMYNIITES